MQGMASIYLSFILKSKPILVKGAKDRFRDLIYIDDVVQAWLLAWENANAFGKTYNLGTGRKTAWRNCSAWPDRKFRPQRLPGGIPRQYTGRPARNGCMHR